MWEREKERGGWGGEGKTPPRECVPILSAFQAVSSLVTGAVSLREKTLWLDSVLVDPTVSGQTWSSPPEVFSFFEPSHSVLARKVLENYVPTWRSVQDTGEDSLRQFYVNVFVRGTPKVLTHLLWAHMKCPLCDGYTGVFRQFPGHSSLQIRAGEWVWNMSICNPSSRLLLCALTCAHVGEGPCT